MWCIAVHMFVFPRFIYAPLVRIGVVYVLLDRITRKIIVNLVTKIALRIFW